VASVKPNKQKGIEMIAKTPELCSAIFVDEAGRCGLISIKKDF
jgi:hypothetical protein